MYKIAVLGDRDSVLGFKALGLDTHFVETTEEARASLHRLAKEDYAIIYIEETLAKQIKADIDKFKESPRPAIILIPGREGSLGIGMNALREAVDKAVGIDILKD